MLLIINPTINGYSVVFNFNGTLVSGEVADSDVPNNVNTFSYKELESKYFPIWKEIITNSLDDSTKKEVEENKAIEEISICPLLTYKEGCYYRLNETVSLPKEIALEYIKYQNDIEKIQSLDNFWYFLALNDVNQREMIFNWLKCNEFQITSDGLIVGYRNVIKYKNNFTINVESSYKTIKKRKKSPKNYSVDKDGNLTKEDVKFNLFDIYHKNKIIYTHDRNTFKRLFYTLGEETFLDRNEVDFSNTSCSQGLHYFGIKFMEEAGQNYCGNITVCVLINPMLVASCPDNYDKGRAVELYFCDIVQWEDNKIVPLSKEELDYHSKNYATKFKIDLNNFLNSNILDSFPKYIGLNKKEIQERLIITV